MFKFLQRGIPIIYQGEEIGIDENPMDDNPKLMLKKDEPRDKSVYLDPNFLSSIDLQSRFATVWYRSEDPNMDHLKFWSTGVIGRDNTPSPIN